ncbi:hypothetical protein GIB67_033088 [Kingdonia uniflora]|uniref:Pre-rRNA-processing protein RIX1 N-terminal domain-containing protein n=1 Tax=Kingdonia uniflora TaxID=39325 RepID=A0A7J7MYX6_9MAGN|nr:hypothetical protein GIB67_033088 [Kingdonia uniflora]
MSSMEFYNNMYDVRLKPTKLRRLIKDHLPNDNDPFPSPQELFNLVSSIKNLGLLSESFREPKVDQKLIDKWKSAVDAWVDRLILLVLSNMINKFLGGAYLFSVFQPDKCWAGISLIGVTCQECSADRFLASYSAWFSKLLLQFQFFRHFTHGLFLMVKQTSSDSQFVKVASCASMSDLFIRLSGFSNVKKDATSNAGKLIQPLLKLLSEDGSEALWEAAVDLLRTVMKFFPSSLHRYYESVEAVIYSKIMSVKCNPSISKKFADCLALLPKTKGDEGSWSLMMQKTLITINNHLTVAFQGLEKEGKDREALKLLVPPGKDASSPLGGEDASHKAENRSEQVIMSKASVLMSCCCKMLTSPYPVQVESILHYSLGNISNCFSSYYWFLHIFKYLILLVSPFFYIKRYYLMPKQVTVPIQPLLELVSRVLLVDGSLSPNTIPFITVMQQEFICSDLLILHLHGLDLLIAVIKGIRSQLLPHAAGVVRLLKEYFKKCESSPLRIKVYSVMQILLISMGVGMALYLAQEVINNAIVDLDSVSHGSCLASTNTYSKAATYKYNSLNNRKRKQGTSTGSLAEHQSLVVEPKNKLITPISVQIAALRALEALLTIGGALRSESWQSDVDLLLITVATKACDGKWVNEEKGDSAPSSELTPTWADFQLTALRALLASLLSSALHRPPYLAEGLHLFRRGKQEMGTKLAEFCAHALLALEVLIHPRSLSLEDFPTSTHGALDKGYDRRLPDSLFSASQKHSSTQNPSDPFSRSLQEREGQDAYDDLYSSWVGNGEEDETTIRSTETIMDITDEPSQKNVQQPTEDPPAEKPLLETPVIEARVMEEIITNVDLGGGNRDEVMVDFEKLPTPINGADVGTTDAVSNHRDDVVTVNEMVSGGEAMVDVANPPVQNETNKLYSDRWCNDSDLESLPDVVVNDPDTESD